MQQLSFLPGEMTPGERSLIQRALKTLDRHLHEPGVAFTSTREFRLDNGGNDEGFGPLTITLQLKDKYGQTLVTRKMETEAFGDSNATRTTDAFLETECVENVATTEIIKATEESNGHRVSLPLSVFNPQDYHPLLITVSGKNVN
ncbi:IrmA family protein [Escherichia coli]|uniref:IrmA family protein n=1 Tax=Escherichia coli TaxID=562 RepID=UPI002168D0BA|nr:IrmA family protein [Escherichia coli]